MKKIFISAVSVALAVFVMNSEAEAQQADRVLVKIDDVKVVQGRTAGGDACEFNVVVYNRSGTDLTSAILEFRWEDKTIGSVLTNEKSEAGLGKKIAQTKDDEKLSVQIDVPAMAAYKQTTIASTLSSDRCFLLMSEGSIIVKRCTAALARKDRAEGMQGGGANRACAPFEFVAATDPQYYKDFQKLSVEEQKKLEQSKFDKEKEEIENEYNKAISTFEEVNSVLKEIKN